MSGQAHPTSPPRSFAPRRRRKSSSDSYYSCDTSSFRHPRSPTSPLFQTPPSSLTYFQNYFAPALPSRALTSEHNFSQISLGHSSNHSSATNSRYPEPYSNDPFLPLGELRSLRSNEQLRSPTSRPSTSPPSLPHRAVRRPPPAILDALPDSKPVIRRHQAKALDDRDPEVGRAGHAVAELIAMPSINEASGYESESSHAHTAASDLGPLSPLFNPSSLGNASVLYGGEGTTQQPPDSCVSLQQSASIATRSIAERRAAPSSDVNSTLRLAFGVHVREVGSRGVNVCETPGASQVEGSAWDAQEQDVQTNVNGGTQEPESVGNPDHYADASEIRVDPDKTPTNEPTLSPWAPGPVAVPAGRRRPPPIYTGNQAQRSAGVKVSVTTQLESRPNEEISELKTESPTDVSSSEGSSSCKQSDASQFSMFMLPPSPTTPLYMDILRGGRSPEDELVGSSSHHPPTPLRSGPRHPLLRGEVNPGSKLSGLPTPRPSPLSPSAHKQPSLATPSRRVFVETEQVAQPNMTSTQSRLDTMSSRASTDGTILRRQHLAANQMPRRPATTESLLANRASLLAPAWDPRSRGVSQPQSPAKPEPTTSRQRSDSCSSEYSHASTDSESCYSDDGASVTTSVAAAALQAREERRLSQQSRAAYMRQSITSSVGRLPTQRSRTSSLVTEASVEPKSSVTTGEGDYQTDTKTSASFDSLSRPPIINVLPPSRKPVPRAEVVSIVSQPIESESRRSLPDPPMLRGSVSAHSLKSLQPVTRKRKPGKIVISHPHLNDSGALGAQILPKGTIVGSANTALFEGSRPHRLMHSKSMATLKDKPLSKEKRDKVPKPPFDKHGMPSEEQLKLASNLFVFDDQGQKIRFGDVFEGQKTAVCFIRHFWCPLCQDYMSSIVHLTEPAFVQKAGVKLIIIGNGSPAMIKSYRDDIFNCPYELYTDPTREVYNALGMTLRTTEGGEEIDKGSYVKHGTFTGTMMVLKNALKMPIANAGDIKQLGGEFILGPGLTCSFTSRMHNTRSHTPIRDLLEAAGVDTNPWATELSLLQSGAERARWMDVQNEDLDRMIRRGLRESCGDKYCDIDGDGDKGKDAAATGALGLHEFRKLLEQLKAEILKPASEPETDINGPSYAIEVMGQGRIELNRLGAVLQSRNGSGTWDTCRSQAVSTSRPPAA